jgi:hypothetical protein
MIAAAGRRIPTITVWQPWATLIAIGAKPYEFRRWPAPKRYRGTRVGIHAGARPVRRTEVAQLLLHLRAGDAAGTALDVPAAAELLERVHSAPGSLPLSSLICTALMGEPRRCTDLFAGSVADSDRIDEHVWGWPMSEVRRLQPVVPASGAQGWWWCSIPEGTEEVRL